MIFRELSFYLFFFGRGRNFVGFFLWWVRVWRGVVVEMFEIKLRFSIFWGVCLSEEGGK